MRQDRLHLLYKHNAVCAHICASWSILTVIVIHGNQSPNAKKMKSVFLLYDIKVMLMYSAKKKKALEAFE